jgi:hypothetical protein
MDRDIMRIRDDEYPVVSLSYTATKLTKTWEIARARGVRVDDII